MAGIIYYPLLQMIFRFWPGNLCIRSWWAIGRDAAFEFCGWICKIQIAGIGQSRTAAVAGHFGVDFWEEELANSFITVYFCSVHTSLVEGAC